MVRKEEVRGSRATKQGDAVKRRLVRKRKKEDRRKERKTERGFRLHREGERLRSEPETDELMLETTGGPCFRASNDLAGATTCRWY